MSAKVRRELFRVPDLRLLSLICTSLSFFFFFFFFNSCCSHLEHSASLKSFVSLQSLKLRQSVGLLGRAISPSQGRYLTQTQNKHKQASIPWVVFEPTIPVFERAKTVHHALDHATTVIGYLTALSINHDNFDNVLLVDHWLINRHYFNCLGYVVAWTSRIGIFVSGKER
jgi:hypothetical protein